MSAAHVACWYVAVRGSRCSFVFSCPVRRHSCIACRPLEKLFPSGAFAAHAIVEVPRFLVRCREAIPCFEVGWRSRYIFDSISLSFKRRVESNSVFPSAPQHSLTLTRAKYLQSSCPQYPTLNRTSDQASKRGSVACTVNWICCIEGVPLRNCYC